MSWRSLTLLALAGSLSALTACSTVPQNRRQYLADPTMQLTDDALEAQSVRQLHSSREGAAGGDARAAGGGCACGN